jgi:hypothetical protein
VPIRVGAGKATCVRLGPDRRDRVDEVDLVSRRRWDEVELRLGAVSDEDLGQLLELDVRVRKRLGPQPGSVELNRERQAHVRRVDAEDLARLEGERVPDDQVAEAREARVGHQTPTRSTRLMKSEALREFIVGVILIAIT